MANITQTSKHLVVGLGEIGSAIREIFQADGVDPFKNIAPVSEKTQYLHICIPYEGNFSGVVEEYQKKYKPELTIIHSTVPVGTTEKLNAVHSPVLGIHPHLLEGIKTFTKFIGGKRASEVADEFRRAGLKIYIYEDSRTTELMKILDTTFYGVCIEYTKDVKEQCKRFGVPFEAWTLWTNNYNEGYNKLGHPEYTRPNLVPIMTPIKGHCVMQNSELLDTKFTDFLKENGRN